jgi:DNA-binding MarR family transcriptional regulator
MDRDHVDTLLAQWADQRPEMDTSALAISARIIRLERFLSRATSDAVSQWDLNEGELNVLASLRRSGPPFALTPTDLYRGLLLSSGAMTNRIDRLEAQGLVERRSDEHDGRRILVILTASGRGLIDEAMDANVSVLADALEGLDGDERDALTTTLRRLLVRLETHGAG